MFEFKLHCSPQKPERQSWFGSSDPANMRNKCGHEGLMRSFRHRGAVDAHPPLSPSLLALIRLLAASAVLNPGLCLRVSNYADLGLWDHVS